VAEVDCTVDDTQTLCGAVEGFPTIKYGDPSALDDYEGGREYESFSSFAKENLKPSCSLTNLHLCNDDIRKEIKILKALPLDDLLDKLEAVDDQIYSLEEVIGLQIEELEGKINDAVEKYTQAGRTLMAESNYKIMKAIVAAEGKYMEHMEDMEKSEL
jgi:hypothetical protein